MQGSLQQELHQPSAAYKELEKAEARQLQKNPSRASNVRPHSPGIRVKAISCDSSPITDWHYSSQTESTFS